MKKLSGHSDSPHHDATRVQESDAPLHPKLVPLTHAAELAVECADPYVTMDSAERGWTKVIALRKHAERMEIERSVFMKAFISAYAEVLKNGDTDLSEGTKKKHAAGLVRCIDLLSDDDTNGSVTEAALEILSQSTNA